MKFDGCGGFLLLFVTKVVQLEGPQLAEKWFCSLRPSSFLSVIT